MQAEAGQVEAARQTAQAIPDPDRRSTALLAIAEAQARAGQVEAALQTAQAIENPGRRSWALRTIADMQAEAGQVEAARQTAQAIPDLDRRSTALLAIAEAQARAGQVEAALPAARAIADPYWRCRALQDIVEGLVASGNDAHAAQGILQEAVQTLNAVPHEWRRTELLESIACLQVSIGVPDQAMTTTRLILIDREKRLPAIVQSFLKANDRTAFKELLIPCAAHLESAWKVCGLLAGAYPEQATAIAEVALCFTRMAV
jgi:hypothetical protein